MTSLPIYAQNKVERFSGKMDVIKLEAGLIKYKKKVRELNALILQIIRKLKVKSVTFRY